MKTKEFLLRTFTSKNPAQSDFLQASLAESDRRDIEDDDFYEFDFEKRTGTSTFAQQSLKKHNISSKNFVVNL